MMTDRRTVTPTLFVVPEDDPRVMPFDKAVDYALMGEPAYVTNDDQARSILFEVGLSSEEVEDRINFSHTGRISA